VPSTKVCSRRARAPPTTRGTCGEAATGLLALIRPAILAANAYNTQPWLFELGTDRINLFADTSRSMGTMGPLRREMVFSLGCAVENLTLAAQANGLKPSITLLPDPADETHVARVNLSPGSHEVTDQYLAIANRHTDPWRLRHGSPGRWLDAR
jgi:hypothetical protein